MKYFIILLTMVCLINCGESNKMSGELKSKLTDFIDQQPGEIAVSLEIPEKNIYIGINDTVVMHAASTMKVPVMIEVFKQAEQGKFALSDSLVVKNEFKSIIDSSLYSMDINEDSGDRLYSMLGKKESIRNLVIDMVIWSGNLATNLLIDLVKAENVQITMDKMGAPGMQVLRGVEDIKAYRAGKNNSTTAKALTDIFTAILAGNAANTESTREMIEILLQQKFNDKIPAKLPADVKVAHKTGSITAISHDSGIIYPKQGSPYVLTVLTRGFENPDEAKQAIAEISRMVFVDRQ
jgi:beta-lactamase class A